ncbi:MAG: DMT family transporter [Actinobacteria bacterium]|nr:DMT family transporter [Actinomycetota bacterium]
MAIFLALFSSALWGSADFEAGRLAKKFPAIAVTGMTQACGLIFGLLILGLSGGWHAVAFGSEGYFLPAVLAGISGYFGLVCLYAGLATGRMGVVSPISSICAVIPVTIALLSGEHLPAIKAAGVAVAILGAFLASGPEIRGGVTTRPLLLALGAATGFGFALTFMARGSQSSALMTMVMMRCTTLLISLAIALRYRSVGGFTRREIPRLAYIGVADFSANLLLGIASTQALVSVVMVLGSLFPIMTALLAYIFLHERLHRVQYWGIAFAITGVALISGS